MAQYRLKAGGMHEAFRNSRNKIQIIGGGFGNGKSAAVCVRAIELCKQYPGCNGLISMATYAQLNDTIREEFYKWVPHATVKRWPTVNDNTLIFKNGSKVNFRYVKQKGKAAAADGQTSSNLLSATYDWIIVDQIENPEITYKDFLDLLGRLRGSTAYRGADEEMPKTGPRWLMLTANPSYNWVWHKLIKPMKVYKDHGRITDDLILWPGTDEPMIDLFEGATYENEHNLEPDFIAGLESAYKGQFRDRYLGGDWGAFEGLVYPQFDKTKHILPKHKMIDYLIKLGHKQLRPNSLEGFDFGITAPSCYLTGFVDFAGRIFILDGFYEPGLSIQKIGTKIVTMQREYSAFIEYDKAIRADPAIFRKTVVKDGDTTHGQEADTVKKLLTNAFDELMFKAGQNDIMNGIMKVGSYLSVTDFPHYDTYERNGCLIYFADHLQWLFDEFDGYFWQMSKGFERIDKPIDRNDHGMDTLKYMFSWLPEAQELLSKLVIHNMRNEEWLMKRTLGY